MAHTGIVFGCKSEQSAQQLGMTLSLRILTLKNWDIFAEKTTQLNDYFPICKQIKHLLIITPFLLNSLLYNAN